MRYVAIVNANAGTVSALGAERIRKIFREKLGQKLVLLRIVRPRHIKKAINEALALSPDAVLVLGGDGTARFAAQLCATSQTPVAFLPGGTMNILPKRLFGDLSLEEILDELAHKRVAITKIAAGFAGEAPFFVAAGFGYIPLLARARENHREALTLRDQIATFGRIFRHGARLFKPSLVFDSSQTGRCATAALLVALGDMDELVPGRDAQSQRPVFEIVSLKSKSWTSLGAIALNVLARRNWRNSNDVDSALVEELRIERRGRIRVTLDGEPMIMKGPLRIWYAREGITALALKSVPEKDESIDAALASV